MAYQHTKIQAVAWAALTTFILSTAPALAHTGGQIGGLQSGFMHPITGLDHVIAMVAVGLWGGILRAPAIWVLPIVFPLMMAVSGAFAIAGFPLAGVEPGIALSGIVLGMCVLFVFRPPLWTAVGITAVFAVFHGYAHGAELPDAANPVAYAVGFVLATGMLHLMGIVVGQLATSNPGMVAVRAIGAAIAVGGAAFLTGFA